MKRFILVLCLLGLVAGCADVQLSPQAMTAAENSALRAVSVLMRTDPNGLPADIRAYLPYNAQQWLYFVRAAKRDPNWAIGLKTSWGEQ